MHAAGGAGGAVLIMRMIRGDEGGEKVRSVREAEQPGDGDILVQPVDHEPAADQLLRQTSAGGLVIE